jgi:hypothetical protein
LIDWLKKRLSGAQEKSDRYVELSEALQEYWEENFDDQLQDQINARSIYTASKKDLYKRIAELGDRFSADYPTEYDQPLALAWRRYEIKRKDTEFLIKNSFRRNFGNLDVEWVRVWANKKKDYGDDLQYETSLTQFERDHLYFLTSRGVIEANLGHLHALGMAKDEFLVAAVKIVHKSRPAHIVYDGIIFFTVFNIVVPDIPVSPMGVETETVNTFHIPAMPIRYDYVSADETTTDASNMSFTCETIIGGPGTGVVLEWKNREPILDTYLLFDDVPADFCPLDVAIGPHF